MCFIHTRKQRNPHIKTALQDFGTAHVIKGPNKAFLVEITDVCRETGRQSGTLYMSAVFFFFFSFFFQARLLGEVYVSGLLRCLHHRETREVQGIYEISTK